MVSFDKHPQFCFVRYGNGMGYTTSARSLFEAGANAINWAEVECRQFRTSRVLPDDEILTISVGVGEGTTYLVEVGRIREWIQEQQANPPPPSPIQ